MKIKGTSDQGFSRLSRAIKSQTKEDYEEFDLAQSEPAEDYEEFDFAQSEPEEYEKQEKYPREPDNSINMVIGLGKGPVNPGQALKI